MKKTRKVSKPIRNKNLPITVAMFDRFEKRVDTKLGAFRNEVKSDLHGMKSDIHGMKSEIHGIKAEIHEVKAEVHEVKAEVQGLKSEIHGVKSEVQGLKSEIHGLKSEFHGFKGQLDGVKSELHRVALLVEEQNARNKYVMDGYAQIYELLVKDRGGLA